MSWEIYKTNKNSNLRFLMFPFVKRKEGLGFSRPVFAINITKNKVIVNEIFVYVGQLLLGMGPVQECIPGNTTGQN